MKIKQYVKPLLTLIIKLFWIFPIKKNKILFSAFSARSFSDNPKYIAKQVIDENLKVDCVFVLRAPGEVTLPDGIRSVKYNTLRFLYELATSKIWVDNTRKQNFVVKRRGQVYIQTWHGSIPFKKIEKDIESTLSDKYIKTAQRDSKMIDYLLTNSSFGKEICRNAFWYDGEIRTTGTPRVDKLLTESANLRMQAINALRLDPKTHYVLYAPTFRDNGDTRIYRIDFKRISQIFADRFGGEWKIILKLHPNIKDIGLGLDGVIDATSFPDIIELYSVASVLVTDYSSAMFDFSLTKKPVFLLMEDWKSFSKIRSTYFRREKLPFPVANNIDELSEKINDFDANVYALKLRRFYGKLSIVEDGLASHRVVSLMRNVISDSNR
ncbi:CDP-glycerol glycerophosphotransferase family protein [Levilactobacillus hammesii]|uniref:CDP-glycerol poly(Glycerophosphate) glycerophosphotransferase n=1 Tax=Levilactobacillus hammesii DSM 16381 TaxID=1423753 RepID=A0A0R1ULV6_9LACO|nr:CDP-glycerol glycerophosphotransferase family protein [Levilactobacillus hammesii]KRL94206.1 CDP-glycerol poly(glycerophosphate) glycerophosphotransferase [Levilactobacillus hammesii DSM 16381]